MSDTPQGPGWWIASDGKWYPPQDDPGVPAQPPPPSAGQQPAPGPPGPVVPTAPMVTPAPPPANKGLSRGCLISIIVVAVVLVLGVGGCFVAVGVVGKKASDSLEDAFTEKPCTIITSKQASDVLGSDYEAVQVKGVNTIMNIALDTRVLPDADACWVRLSDDTEDGYTIRVAQQGGGSSKFAKELENAKGTTEDAGGGLSLESSSYFSKMVEGVGDEAFCTSSDFVGSSGVLVRDGDTLTYVSGAAQSSSDESIPTIDDDANCDLAVKVAKKIIG